MKQMDIKSLVNYVALKILGGSDYILEALEKYLVKGEGPATVAYEYQISKHQLRGYAQRIIEKSGSEGRAKKILPIIKGISKDVKPIVKRTDGDLYYCTLCNTSIPKEDTEEHVRKYHKEILTSTIKTMLERLEEYKKEKQAVILTSVS
ncbi:hypothetical protein [Sulfolobus acidocaldarius]|uniref:Conserved protein n=4 Tax=Sulfolobus acidocaldarius TaxID=2285 RepID=Q4J8F3_SULAC|nr:hypothetical protein [Sulfolobus acidocaldarius]AAY80927.1 conserved protein [Sulfolobus acidocaldarius DSM 639]AGE71528.1 hypothetical protein SacN8_07840 [Sulfolobus acidocaldarius N8]AGE73801.1 hypothetical protein SacRon12I_07850 [Sulfolobus acidocaldarius Ron12/I]ALU30649.1 hypothetical protein ATY89_10030 [Sulfolobus acidocaldarius]ALU32741.1 hypothetical protein ATZ20_01585 [Sulfolobus acidocaldarius]